MDSNDFCWKDVPEGWPLCFNSSCPLHDKCLRFQAGLKVPDNLTITRCVTPRALTGEQCKHFAPMVPVRFAYGFSAIYEKVLKAHYTSLRKCMTMMLSGKRYYYEYMNGKRALTPEQQDQIRLLFKEYGYEDQVRFDRFEEHFAFPWR